jgi:hypothetical protein
MGDVRAMCAIGQLGLRGRVPCKARRNLNTSLMSKASSTDARPHASGPPADFWVIPRICFPRPYDGDADHFFYPTWLPETDHLISGTGPPSDSNHLGETGTTLILLNGDPLISRVLTTV